MAPLECNEPDLRLWSLNVIALLHSENEKAMEFGGAYLGGTPYTRPNMDMMIRSSVNDTGRRSDHFYHIWAYNYPSTAQTLAVGSTIDGANVPFHVVFS